MADNSQIERVGVNKTEAFFIEEFEWIVREQTILDYGIDMHIEIKDKGKPTGVLIGLQIKSGNSHCTENKQGNFFTYRGELRHLEYWQNHSLPVIFIWYNPFNQKLYWELVSFESSNINLNKKSWTLKIPSNQTLDTTSKDDILNRCFNPNNYQVIEESNNSTRRIIRYRLRVIVPEKNKYIIKKIIEMIHNRYIKLYEKIQSFTVFYYRNNSMEIPFCQTQWNNPNFNYRLELNKNDECNGIDIAWDYGALYFNQYRINEDIIISKYKYIDICDKSINLCNEFIDATKYKKISEIEYIISISKESINEEVNTISSNIYSFTIEVQRLHNIRLSAINRLHSLVLMIEDGTFSEIVYLYIDDIQKDIERYNFEKKEIL